MAAMPATPLTTTWPCLTEAMHLLYDSDGLRAQNELWTLLSKRLIRLELLSADDWPAIQSLMNRYGDMPLDMADASLVVAAQKAKDWKLFSMDSRLRAIRLPDEGWLDVYPHDE